MLVLAAVMALMGIVGWQPVEKPAALVTQPTLKRTIPLTKVDGRIDHLAFDPKGNRLFVVALGNGSLEAIDLAKGERVKSVGGLKEPQGVVFVAATGQVVVASGGDGTVRAFDGVTLEERKKVTVGEDADNMRLSEDGKTIVVGYGSGALAILDAATLEKTGEVKLPDHPEAFELEPGTDRVFVNVPGGFIGGGGRVVVVDRKAKTTLATWELKEAGRNFPMALDAKGNRLFVGCRRSARLLVMDTGTGKVVASPECVGDEDEVFTRPGDGVVVVGGDGAIDVFSREFVKTSTVKTVSGVRTGFLMPGGRMLYVAVPRRSGHDAEIREYELPE